LQSVPLSIIGVSYSVAAFPNLARYFANGERSKFVDQIANAAKHIIFWSLPITVLFVVLRAQIVRVILGSGQFNWEDTRLTAAALAAFVISLVAQSLVLLFTRGYYASGNTKKPLYINLLCSGLAIVLAYAMIRAFSDSAVFRGMLENFFKINDLAGSAIVVLPLAFTLGSILNAVLHWVAFVEDFGDELNRVLARPVLHSILASAVLGEVSYVSLQFFSGVFNLNTFSGIFLQGFLAGLLGIISGIVVLILIKNPELSVVKDSLAQKFWKSKPTTPGQEDLA
jgi:putative peptidoglycan lipid II flippase